MKSAMIGLLLTTALLQTGRGQDSAHVAVSDSVTSIVSFRVSAGGRDVSIYDDSLLLGKSPLENHPVAAGSHVFRYVESDDRSWYATSFAETLFLETGESIVREIELPVFVSVTSEPGGARVEEGDTLLGQTPLLCRLKSSYATLRLSRAGSETSEVVVEAGERHVHVVLRDILTGSPERTTSYISPEQTDDLPLYIIAAATVLSGTSAAYFKIKADNAYSDYQFTGDSNLLDGVRRHDAIAGVSLAVSEIGIGLLTYLLLSR